MPPNFSTERFIVNAALSTLALLGFAALAYALTACASSAPPEVLRADVTAVVSAKARAVARPTPAKIGEAAEAKTRLVLDLCCYTAPPDAGHD